MRDLIGKQERGSIGTRPGLQADRGKSPHVDGLAPRGRSIETFRADLHAKQDLPARRDHRLCFTKRGSSSKATHERRPVNQVES